MIETNELMTFQQQLEGQLVLVKEMQVIKNEVSEMKDDIKKDVQELRDSITLTRTEGSEIQSAVGSKAWKLTRKVFGKEVSDDLFMAKTGHLRGVIYKRVKDMFNIPRYYDLRRIDFKHALNMIDAISFESLTTSEKRMTVKCKQAAEINNDDISSYDIA